MNPEEETVISEVIIKEIEGQKIDDVLTALQQVVEKLDAQSSFYTAEVARMEYEASEEYAAEQALLNQENEKLKEEIAKLEEQRHTEIVEGLQDVSTVAGDQTTSTTLIDSFNTFADTYDKNVTEFNEMLWLVFITALIITAFKQLGNQIWRV